MKKAMILVALAFASSVILPSCSKEQTQKKIEDIVVQVMTDGIWLVTSYQEGGNDLTSLFTNWESQFFDNKTSKGRNTATGDVVNGTWDGSYANQTMTANFDNIAPVNKMNGTWKIIRSTYTVGEFSRMENGVEIKLQIMKK